MNSQQLPIASQPNSEVVRLTNQSQQLTRAMDQWNSGMLLSLWLAFLAAAAVAMTTRMVVIRSKQLTDVQNRLQNLSDSRATQEKLQLESQLSLQQERTAKAEAALLQIQMKVRDREITPGQEAKLVELSRNRPTGVVTIQRLNQDPEAVEYAQQLFAALEKAGWTPVFPPGKVIGGTDPGLSLSVYSAAQLEKTGNADGNDLITASSSVFYGRVLKEALQGAGITINEYKVRSGPPIPRDSVYIAVGSKPLR